MHIGSLELQGSAVLAPLAGVADRAMRELCLSYGAAMVTTEMVSAKGFTMGDRKSRELLKLSDLEHPGAIQLFGYDPTILAEAAKRVEAEFPCEAIDLNMGCPAPKITGNNAGSSLLRDPDLAVSIAKAVVEAVSRPVTVKMRTGWDPDHLVCVDLAKRLEDAGVAALTVHGRTKDQMYAPPVDRSSIKAVVDAVSIPVIANGDVRDGPSAKSMLEETGAAAVMVGRGATGHPWVFEQINAYLKDGTVLPEPTIEEKMQILLDHSAKICEYKGDYIGMRESRKHAAWYIKGMRGAAKFRDSIGKLSTKEELIALTEAAVKDLSISDALVKTLASFADLQEGDLNPALINHTREITVKQEHQPLTVMDTGEGSILMAWFKEDGGSMNIEFLEDGSAEMYVDDEQNDELESFFPATLENLTLFLDAFYSNKNFLEM